MGTQADLAVMSELSDHGRDSRNAAITPARNLPPTPPLQPRPADSPAPACPCGAWKRLPRMR